MLSLSTVFFFNDTATTDIYTFCHPLSPLDSLPILFEVEGAGSGYLENLRAVLPAAIPALGPVLDELGFVVAALEARDVPIVVRSEEHTSELQSLMRTSYAVFCVKQKNLIDTSQMFRRYLRHTIPIALHVLFS